MDLRFLCGQQAAAQVDHATGDSAASAGSFLEKLRVTQRLVHVTQRLVHVTQRLVHVCRFHL